MKTNINKHKMRSTDETKNDADLYGDISVITINTKLPVKLCII